MVVEIKEIIVGKYEYDTAVCNDGLQIVIKKGQEKFAGKKVKIEDGILTEAISYVKPADPVKKYVKK